MGEPSASDRRPILVTGGAGFIGSYVVERCLARGLAVAVIDDLSTGRRENLPPGTLLAQASILEDDALRFARDARPRAIVHCAAQVSVPASMADPLRDLAVNVVGTARMLAVAREVGVERFVFLSSGGAIYGETARPADEETPPQPSSYYGVHKLAAEHHVILSGVPYGILRPSNVYGPRQRDDQEGGVVSIFARRIARGEPITIFGDGRQERDFVHARDVADAVMAVLDRRESGIWNVSSGRPTTVLDLAATIEAVAGRRVERVFAPRRPGDVERSVLDSARLRRETGWRPRVALEEGVRELVRGVQS